VEVHRIDILFPVHTLTRYPYLVQVPDTSQIPVEVVGEVGSVVVYKTMREGQHLAGELLPLDAPDHIASHSSSVGLVAPAVAKEIAALRYSLSLSVYVNTCKISFISYYAYIFKEQIT
jgi:hypothetical protein